MTSTRRFSIVIPTRNRLSTLTHSLRTCLSQIDFDDYEVVISDNSDDDETQVYIADLVRDNDAARRLISYHKRPHVCSMAENFDAAVACATGEYIIVIGDDDGILPMALAELDRLATSTNARVIKWRNGLFLWPTLDFNDQSNYLGFCLLRSKQPASARDALKQATETFRYENLPLLYINAAVHRDVVAEMKGGAGRIFRSREPDVYSGIVLSYLCDEFVSTTIPFTLAGLSNFSTGISASFGGPNVTPRKEFNDLYANTGIRHHPHVPNMPIFPIVDFSNSFYLAKSHRFPNDSNFTLSRRHVMEACIARVDTQNDAVKQEMLRVCADDPVLTRHVLDLMAKPRDVQPPPRLKPVDLGSDYENLHVDARDFGLATIEDAVRFVHNIVWPRCAALRYDLEPLLDVLIERTDRLQKLTDFVAALPSAK